MRSSSIPVDLLNPGQVFACLGFLEAAGILLGDAEGGFDWTEVGNVRFGISAAGDGNPFSVVLEFLATSELERWGPLGYTEAAPRKAKADEPNEDEGELEDSAELAAESENKASALVLSDAFPAGEGDRMSLPIRL